MNDPMFGNKLAAAILTALLIVFTLPLLTGALFGGGHGGGGHGGGHGEGHGQGLALAYPIEIAGLETEEAEAAPTLTLAQRLQTASASSGERRAGLCKSCHSFEKGGANGTGPALWNVVGRPVASVDGFGYSAALQGFGGEWTWERLDAYLENSQEYIPGTAMAQRLGKPEQRADILAYLQTLSDDPETLPQPEATADAGEAGDAASGEGDDASL